MCYYHMFCIYGMPFLVVLFTWKFLLHYVLLKMVVNKIDLNFICLKSVNWLILSCALWLLENFQSV